MLLAIEDIPDRLQQIGTAGLLGNITRGTELQRTGGVLGIRVHTQDEYRGLGATGADLPQDREAVIDIGKADIENHEMPRLCLDASQGFFGGFRLAKDDVAELVTKHLLQTQTNEQMIIDN
jgi:hypothetical protein